MDLLGVRLKVLVDNQTDDNIKDALEEIFQKLDCLNVAASNLAKMSESLSGHIAQVNPITQPWLAVEAKSMSSRTTATVKNMVYGANCRYSDKSSK